MPNPIRKYTYYLRSIFTLLTGIREWQLVVRVFLGAASWRDHPAAAQRLQLVLAADGYLERQGGPARPFLPALRDRDRRWLDGRGYRRRDRRVHPGGRGAHPQNRVFAFEPFAESFALLQENLGLNGADNVTAYPEAVGAQTGSLLLDLPWEPLQLQSIQGAGELASQDVRPVSSLSLADVFTRLDLMRIDLLKLDCEGSEYPIFFNAGPNTWSASSV